MSLQNKCQDHFKGRRVIYCACLLECCSPCTDQFNIRARSSHSRGTRILQNLDPKALSKQRVFFLCAKTIDATQKCQAWWFLQCNISPWLWSLLRFEAYELPKPENIWWNWSLMEFSPCRILFECESFPILVHASVAINPLQTVELQQHKPKVSLPPVDSPVKTEITSLCQSLLRPTEICTCYWNGANTFTGWIFYQKSTGVPRWAQRQTSQQQLLFKGLLASKFSIKLSFLNLFYGSHDVPFSVNTSANVWF